MHSQLINKNRNLNRRITIPKLFVIFFSVLLIASILLIFVSSIMFSPQYVFRTIINGNSGVEDYKIFPKRVIHKSSHSYQYDVDIDDSLKSMTIDYTFNGKPQSKPLSSLLKDSDTSSFIVVQNDKVVIEDYFNGYTKDSVNTSFSMAKSIDSLLIGIAIEKGYIQSVRQSIAEFINEFKGTKMEDITIEDLLSMRSDIRYEEGNIWFGDDAKTYYMPDLRKLALSHTNLTDSYQGNFHYNNYHPLLLGIILERSTDQSVSDFFEQNVWKKIGAEHDASWSLDSKKSAFEKMESGINFKAIDFVKIGSMLLHDGRWNGHSIVNENWIAQSTRSEFPINPDEYKGSFLEGRNIGYQYFWYSTPNDKGTLDYFASGKYGQFLYISPEHQTVILRTGKAMGNVDNWPDILKQISGKVDRD
ncbi:class C beta-lactamase-related serine hydrolase [Neobacillus notoginsengisoli]|uniref:Class C beta-lactamase-related serine hydrolase n=1 Tax=Neobacillus notoginsengisoli TaxID=1578198 RepID=A0A417Z0Y9_9BACI|nr:serine hydrolase [Neobacillus notoginsengisoli]RHW43538.1 class C beta-lactamase-related serine hydrolase [Neobacillus notoginsengisoli]